MTWAEAVTEMGRWYEQNIHTYHGKGDVAISTNGKWSKPSHVIDNCVGFVSACLQLYGVFNNRQAFSSGSWQPDKAGHAGPILTAAGFKAIKFTNFDDLKQWDILSVYDGELIRSKSLGTLAPANRHVEVYNGNLKSWSWGGPYDIKNGGILRNTKSHDHYNWVYRLDDPGAITNPSNNTTEQQPSTAPQQQQEPELPPRDLGREWEDQAINNAYTNILSYGSSIEEEKSHHTRIYVITQPTIILNEMSMTLDIDGSEARQQTTQNNKVQAILNAPSTVSSVNPNENSEDAEDTSTSPDTNPILTDNGEENTNPENTDTSSTENITNKTGYALYEEMLVKGIITDDGYDYKTDSKYISLENQLKELEDKLEKQPKDAISMYQNYQHSIDQATDLHMQYLDAYAMYNETGDVSYLIKSQEYLSEWRTANEKHDFYNRQYDDMKEQADSVDIEETQRGIQSIKLAMDSMKEELICEHYNIPYP